MTGYSSEEDVYEECGMDSTTIQNLTGKSQAEVTALVLKYIESADQRIKRMLKVPITIRKEEHEFLMVNPVALGPYEENLEFFGTYDPVNCVDSVYALYSYGFGRQNNYSSLGHGSGRRKLPYPINCDDLTEGITDCIAGVGTTLSKETTIKKAGTASIKAIFATVTLPQVADWSFFFPSAANLDKRIYSWHYSSFLFRCSDKTSVFTLSLYDINRNIAYKTFTMKFNNTWEMITLDLDTFTDAFDWSNILIQKVKISSSKIGTIYFDNFCFNDGVFWSLPEGNIWWADPNGDPLGTFQVTYSYDPYLEETPADIAECSAKLAAVKILDYCIGARQRYLAFQMVTENMDKTPDKESLEVVRGRIIADVNRMLGDIGFGTNESIGAPV